MARVPHDSNQPQTLNQNADDAILILTADNVQDLEFFYPYYRYIEAGYKVNVATPDGGTLCGKNDLGIKNTLKIADVDASHYQLLYIPGGKAPAQLKKTEEAIQIVKHFVENGTPIGAICHGPQLLAAADVIRGKRISAWPGVKDEIEQAGAEYVSAETLVDGLFVTARWSGDLPMHLKHTLEILSTNRSHRLRLAEAA